MADWANIINCLWLSKIPTIFICKWELNKAVSVLTFEMLCQMTSVRSGGYSHWYYLHVSLLASLVWSFFTAGFLSCLLQAKKCPLCTSLLLHLNSTFSVFLIQMWFKHLIVCKSISFNFFVCTLAVPASQEKICYSRSGGRIFFSRVTFLCWLLLVSVPPPCYRSSMWKTLVILPKVQVAVTAKYMCALHMSLCMKWHGAWLYGVHRKRRDGSGFLWHQPCHRCKYTTLLEFFF